MKKDILILSAVAAVAFLVARKKKQKEQEAAEKKEAEEIVNTHTPTISNDIAKLHIGAGENELPVTITYKDGRTEVKQLSRADAVRQKRSARKQGAEVTTDYSETSRGYQILFADELYNLPSNFPAEIAITLYASDAARKAEWFEWQHGKIAVFHLLPGIDGSDYYSVNITYKDGYTQNLQIFGGDFLETIAVALYDKAEIKYTAR